MFLAYYVAYVAYLILAAQDREALQTYSSVMMGFVIPLTVVTLCVADPAVTASRACTITPALATGGTLSTAWATATPDTG